MSFLTRIAATAALLTSTAFAAPVFAEGGTLVIASTQVPRHLNGSVQSGMFVTTGGTRLVKVNAPDRDAAILGVRADDMDVHEAGQGDIDVTIYAFENTGESTLLTVQWGKQRVIARGDRHLRKDQDDVVGISLNTDHLYLFDPETEDRIRM